MDTMIHSILLQCKFILVEWLNITYSLVPNPIRKWYLRLFGIRLEVPVFTKGASSSMSVSLELVRIQR